MSCRRCGGFEVPEDLYGLYVCAAVRCINCGHLRDMIVRHAPHSERRSSAAPSRGRRRTRGKAGRVTPPTLSDRISA